MGTIQQPVCVAVRCAIPHNPLVTSCLWKCSSPPLTICKPQQCIRSRTGPDSRASAAATAASAAASSALHSRPSRPAAAAVGRGLPLATQGKPLGVKLMTSANLFCAGQHTHDAHIRLHTHTCCSSSAMSREPPRWQGTTRDAASKPAYGPAAGVRRKPYLASHPPPEHVRQGLVVCLHCCRGSSSLRVHLLPLQLAQQHNGCRPGCIVVAGPVVGGTAPLCLLLPVLCEVSAGLHQQSSTACRHNRAHARRRDGM